MVNNGRGASQWQQGTGNGDRRLVARLMTGRTYSANFHLSFPPLLLLLAFPLLLGPKKEILYNHIILRKYCSKDTPEMCSLIRTPYFPKEEFLPAL